MNTILRRRKLRSALVFFASGTLLALPACVGVPVLNAVTPFLLSGSANPVLTGLIKLVAPLVLP